MQIQDHSWHSPGAAAPILASSPTSSAYASSSAIAAPTISVYFMVFKTCSRMPNLTLRPNCVDAAIHTIIAGITTTARTNLISLA